MDFAFKLFTCEKWQMVRVVKNITYGVRTDINPKGEQGAENIISEEVNHVIVKLNGCKQSAVYVL